MNRMNQLLQLYLTCKNNISCKKSKGERIFALFAQHTSPQSFLCIAVLCKGILRFLFVLWFSLLRLRMVLSSIPVEYLQVQGGDSGCHQGAHRNTVEKYYPEDGPYNQAEDCFRL